MNTGRLLRPFRTSAPHVSQFRLAATVQFLHWSFLLRQIRFKRQNEKNPITFVRFNHVCKKRIRSNRPCKISSHVFCTDLFFLDVFTLSQGDVFYRPPESVTSSVYVGESTMHTVWHCIFLQTATLNVLATIKKSTCNHQWRRSVTYNNNQ